MPQRDTPRLIFVSALILLLLSGAFSAWAIYRLYQGDDWVHHTYDVEILLGTVESDLSKAGRARTQFFASGDPQRLQDFADARGEVMVDIARLRTLVADNPDQVARTYRLEAAAKGRLGAVAQAIELAKTDPADKLSQADQSTLISEWAAQTAAVGAEMIQSEDTLLGQRNRITGSRFRLIAVALAASFLLSVFLMWEHYRRLASELKKREIAEQRAQNLSTQVLRAQDEERRRISRELHDGLGQTLVAAKMIADSITGSSPAASAEAIAQLNSILEGGVSSVRTMSYLLHPPLLDEIGLTSAAEWLIDGLAKRSNLSVKLQITGEKRRLPAGVELTLYRIIQESLTNIQRHASSPKADILLNFERNRVTLQVRDHGVGISAEKIRELEERSSSAGLGLAGMRQRAQEQGGTFRLSSNGHGTTIDVVVPVPPEVQIPQASIA
jgi:signal transduction histidine kinase